MEPQCKLKISRGNTGTARPLEEKKRFIFLMNPCKYTSIPKQLRSMVAGLHVNIIKTDKVKIIQT